MNENLKVLIAVEKWMIRSTRLDGFNSPQKGNTMPKTGKFFSVDPVQYFVTLRFVWNIKGRNFISPCMQHASLYPVAGQR